MGLAYLDYFKDYAGKNMHSVIVTIDVHYYDGGLYVSALDYQKFTGVKLKEKTDNGELAKNYFFPVTISEVKAKCDSWTFKFMRYEPKFIHEFAGFEAFIGDPEQFRASASKNH